VALGVFGFKEQRSKLAWGTGLILTIGLASRNSGEIGKNRELPTLKGVGHKSEKDLWRVKMGKALRSEGRAATKNCAKKGMTDAGGGPCGNGGGRAGEGLDGGRRQHDTRDVPVLDRAWRGTEMAGIQRGKLDEKA